MIAPIFISALVVEMIAYACAPFLGIGVDQIFCVYVLFWTLRRGGVLAIVMAVVMGLQLDWMLGMPLLIHTLILSALGLMCGKLKSKFFVDSFWTAIILPYGVCCVFELIRVGILKWMVWPSDVIMGAFLWNIFFKNLGMLLWAPAFFWSLSKFHKTSSWSSRMMPGRYYYHVR